MVSKINKNAMRLKRHVRVRGKISGTPECPRLNVFRSNANIYAQIIDDVNGVTLVSANTLEKTFEGATGNAEAAKKVGLALAERAKAKGIEDVVFDRGGYIYHGRDNEWVDKLSLAISLRDDDDPRVEGEIERLINELKWKD